MQTQLAPEFQGTPEGTEAEANSVIALLMLDSAKGRQIEVEATGPQEEEALAAVIALFNSGFDED